MKIAVLNGSPKGDQSVTMQYVLYIKKKIPQHGYEEHGVYDSFPQNDKRAIEMNKKLIPLIQIDKIRNKMDFRVEFLKPFKKIITDPNK